MPTDRTRGLYSTTVTVIVEKKMRGKRKPRIDTIRVQIQRYSTGRQSAASAQELASKVFGVVGTLTALPPPKKEE